MKKTLTMITAMLLALLFAMSALAVPNPIVEVTDDDAFEDQLGIEFDAGDITASPKTLSVIGGNLGQVAYTLENVNGENVEWYIRFTKDEELAADIRAFSGIYDAGMTEPFTVTATVVTDADDNESVTLDLSCVYAETENATIYTWKIGDAFFCLTANGEVSQMQLAANLDEAVAASADD